MSLIINFNGVDYTIPTTGDLDWSAQLNAYLVALSAANVGGKSPYLFTFANTQNDGNATRYMTTCVGQGTSAGLPLASDWWVPVPFAGTVTALQLKLSALCPADNTGGAHSTWTVRLNGVDTAMTVNVNPNAGHDENTFAYKIDNTHAFDVVAGDFLSVKWVHSFPGAVSNLQYPTVVVAITPT